MDIGMLVRWGSVVPGREAQALAFFDETVAYYGSLVESGKLTSFEPFLFSSSDFDTEQGFFILKAPITEMFSVMDTDEYKTLIAKANLLLHHVNISLLTVGDAVVEQIARFDKARADLHV
ncbi:MAG TPA: hypothetical protein VHO29_03050 [Marmoricola sp.]|nr:hypothetical protein [Marmoricola sp.]